MKRTLRLLLVSLTLTACADSTSPARLTTDDATLDAARSGSVGITTLPTLGGNFAAAVAINDAGAVVGYAARTNSTRTVAGVFYAAKWARHPITGSWNVKALGESTSPTGETIYPAAGARALALNESGDAVGTRAGSALVWPAAGGEKTLTGGAVAEGINRAGIIVGGTTWDSRGTAVVWEPDATSASGWTDRQLPLPEGVTFAHAFAINESGVIAGAVRSTAGREQAVVWLPTADGWDLPVVLAGSEGSLGSSDGFAINERGDVVGSFNTCSGCAFRAALWPWPVSGDRIDLTSLNRNATSGHAHGIDDDMRVVGHFSTRNGANPFLWSGSASLTDLGTGEATGINNRGAFYGQEAVGSKSGSKGSQAIVWRIEN